MRALELKPNGMLFISTMIVNEPELKPYQKSEREFYGRIAQSLLPECLSNNGIKTTEETLSACMKTTTFVQPSHYIEVTNGLSDRLNLLSSESEDIPDLFYMTYQHDKAKGDPHALDKFASHVSKYIKGFWCDIMQEGLHRRLCEDKSKENIGKAAKDLFDELLPQYVRDNTQLYPECYQVFKMKFQKLPLP